MPYQACTTCLMDTSDPNIRFDQLGVCHHCVHAREQLPKYQFTQEQESVYLKKLQSSLVSERSSKTRYDAILGVSGGVDSSYVALLAHRLGLRILLVHCDNGWNSPSAVQNIYNIIKVTNFDLETVVLDWNEFRDLQRSFLYAGVVDIEMLTDHANRASMFKIAKQNKIKTILSGNNFTTEHTMPQAWVWNKRDARNIKSIQKTFGTVPLRNYPFLNTFTLALYSKLGIRFQYVEPLTNLNYIQKNVKRELKEHLDWEEYGGKHHESEFTKFYQTYILPRKFKIDKRRAHLSDLIHSRQLQLEDAREELSKPLYDEATIGTQKLFILNKLKLTAAEFEKIMSSPPVPHDHYGSDKKIMDQLRKLKRFYDRK